MPAYDVVVAGLGVMGSAAADALARRGLRVLGLDRFAPPHDRGSSHGRSRVIREAYFEHPLYVPLVRRAYELWQELERERGARLLTITGLLSVGPADGPVVAGALRSAREHGIAHDALDAAAMWRRWPVLRVAEDAAGVYEARAGLLDPEACVEALQARARAHGAELRTSEPVLAWTARGGGVEVRTRTGIHAAGALVVSAGAWAGSLVPHLARLLRVERRVVHWFAPRERGDELRAGRCPILLWEHAQGRLFYTTPDVGHGVKAAFHNEGAATSPEAVAPPGQEDAARARAVLGEVLPAAAGALLDARTCLYTLTGDGHFLLDRHPEHAQVVLMSPCSGHGFKFAPALGEMAAGMAAGAEGPAAPFAFSRLR